MFLVVYKVEAFDHFKRYWKKNQEWFYCEAFFI